MQDTHVQSLGKGNGNSLQYSCLENSKEMNLLRYGSWGHKELDMIEWPTRLPYL